MNLQSEQFLMNNYNDEKVSPEKNTHDNLLKIKMICICSKSSYNYVRSVMRCNFNLEKFHKIEKTIVNFF